MDKPPGVITPRIFLQVFLVVVILPFLPLLVSGRWEWWQAWVYAVLSILNFIFSRVLALHRHPDLAVERSRILQQRDAKSWDKTLLLWLGLGGILVMLVAGLDARYSWSPIFSPLCMLLGLALILGGYVLSSYALLENRFFSGMARLQTERGHQVVSSGPYRWMRHPGYAGTLLVYLATPLFLNSALAFLPALFTAALFVLRTALEDRFLQTELTGYREYAGRVRYRLLPGVW